jgi:hypothetical protein
MDRVRKMSEEKQFALSVVIKWRNLLEDKPFSKDALEYAILGYRRSLKYYFFKLRKT